MTIKSKHALILNRLRQMQYTMYYDAPAQKELALAQSTIVGLEAEIAELQHNLKNWGTIEIAIRNPAVAESMRHWECRAEKAEAELAALTAQDNAKARLQDVCEIYNGMDGFEPKTAPEDYLLRIVRQMYHAALGEVTQD